MKFCKTCKALAHAADSVCPHCGKKLSPVTDINEPVRLCVIGGTERAMLCGMLDDAQIPHMESNVQPQGVANEIVTGFDVKLNNISVVVPFQALPKASELLGTIESVKNPVEPMMDKIEAHIGYLRSEQKEKPDSAAKRTTIKVITAILFLLLIAAVVLGTDAVTGWIKGLFGG